MRDGAVPCVLIGTPDQVGNYPFSPSHCSPAKAGVHAWQRCAIWTPAFAGERFLTCLKGIYADLIRGRGNPQPPACGSLDGWRLLRFARNDRILRETCIAARIPLGARLPIVSAG